MNNEVFLIVSAFLRQLLPAWRRVRVAFAAILLIVNGLVLLLSGALPAVPERMTWLSNRIPLSLIETAHLLGSAFGLCLLLTARSVQHRLQPARRLAIWLLLGGIIVSLVKGLDIEEAALCAFTALFLHFCSADFHRLSMPISGLSRWSLGSMWLTLGLVAWISFRAYPEVPFEHTVWWQFAIDAHASRTLRALLLITVLLLLLTIWYMLRPSFPSAVVHDEITQMQLLSDIKAAPDSRAHLALLDDKLILRDPQLPGFIMYGIQGHSFIAMGDPIAPVEAHADWIWKFREHCDLYDARCVFYQVGTAGLSHFVDAGLHLFKLGEEAFVDLYTFALEGSTRTPLRQSYNKAKREGVRLCLVEPDQLDHYWSRMEKLSSDWLTRRNAVEKGFSLGYMARDYIKQTPVALILLDDAVVAFANLWTSTSKHELSIDLMRTSELAPKGTMDFLMVELMLWGKAQGYRWFNLGMAPLSGIETHPLAPVWHKVAHVVQQHGETMYNFNGLRRYKEKFLPVWQPRYLAAKSGLGLPIVVRDVAQLIARPH